MWRITIDQIAGSGGLQRYGPYEPLDDALVGAIEDALSLSGLDMVERGQYQITAIFSSIPLSEVAGGKRA